MLVTPKQIKGKVPELKEGICGSGIPFNGHITLSQNGIRLNHEEEYPFTNSFVPAYGVCDSPEQFLEKAENLLKTHKKKFLVMFTYVSKKEQHPVGGWRWHKWGEYIGDGQPTCEYLYDEEGFDEGVFVFHIYDVSRFV